jgi:hypothetical protein
MAEHVETKVVDDLDPSLPGELRTVLGYNDRVVRLDLSKKNHQRLLEALAPFLEHGQVLPGINLVREDVKRRTNPYLIRTWASNKGLEIQQRGRIPQEIEDQYIQEEVRLYNP